MQTELSVEEIIQERWPTLSKSQQRIGQLILEDPKRIAVTSAGALGKELGIATSTVVRTATALGYAGYPEFQQALQQEIFAQPSLVDRLGATDTDALRTPEDAMQSTLMLEVAAMENTVTSQAFGAYDEFVDTLLAARRVFLMGVGVSHASAHVLTVGLRQLGVDARLVGGGATDIAEEMHGAGTEDALVAISMSRYPRRIISTLKYAAARGVKRLAITDSGLSPLAREAEAVLYARLSKPHYFQSIISTVLVINALLSTAASRGGERARASLALMDEEWQVSSSFHRNAKE